MAIVTNTWQDVTLASFGWTGVLQAVQDGVAIDCHNYTGHFVYTAPSGATKTKTASFYTDGVDGQFKYTHIAGDIDETGYWRVRLVVTGTGLNLTSTDHKFTVTS